MEIVYSEDFRDWKNYYNFTDLVGEIQELTRSGKTIEAKKRLRMFMSLVDDFNKSVEREIEEAQAD